VLLRSELQLRNGFETFVDVPLHGFRVFGLGQDFKKFLVREEVEAREESPFSLKIVAQRLLNLIENRIGLIELTFEFIVIDELPNVGFLAELLHSNTPGLVYQVEFRLLVFHLFFDIIAGEDGLEVHPTSLSLNPAVECVLNQNYLSIGRRSSAQYWFYIRARLHH
jgi:hypothetical protein